MKELLILLLSLRVISKYYRYADEKQKNKKTSIISESVTGMKYRKQMEDNEGTVNSITITKSYSEILPLR